MWKKSVKRILSGAMAAMLAFSVPLSAAAEEIAVISPAPSDNTAVQTLTEALDFSREGAVHEQTQAAKALMEATRSQWTGSDLTDEEAAYLASEDIVLRYDEAITGGLVSTTVEGSALTVTAHAESYTADNGKTVTWIPHHVTIGTQEKTLTEMADGKNYEAVFEGLDPATLYTAELTWRAELTVDSETMEELIDRAYGDAAAMIAAQAQYEVDLAAYEAAMTRYRDDLTKYEAQNGLYQDYLKKLAAYETELSAYNDYLAKVKAYEEGVAAYAAYQTALTQYQQDLAAYQTALAGVQAQQEAYNQYQLYLAQVEQVSAKLAVMESVFVADSAGRTMYATLMGDTVATVVSRKSELVAAGASATDVDNAGAATETLKQLLASYQSVYGAQGRYAWYQSNYSAVKSAFISLYSSLNSLYQNTLVRTALNMQGKLERYCQFVSQLYVISTALDDSTTFDSSWRIQVSKSSWASPSDLLDSVQIVADTNAYAPTVSWPAYVAAVEKPVLPTTPTQPVEVAQPVKTWTQELTAPTNKPETVAQPIEPQLSDYTSGEPTKPNPTAELQAVMAPVEAGKLGARTWQGGDASIAVEASLSRSISLSGQPTVTFYNADQKTICYAVQVTEGSPVFYEGEAPTRAADAQYTYTFTGWVDAEGKEADFTSITEDTAFYATYDTTVNRYTVTWVIGEERVEQEYAYGDIPSYRDWQQTFTDETYEYTFTGWSSAVRQVTGNATYTALFRVRALDEATYAVTFTVRDRQVYRTYAYGETPAFDDFEKEYTDSDSRYVFVGWDKEFAPLTTDMQYTAQFERTWLVPAGESDEVGASVNETARTLTVTTDEMVADITWAVAQAKEKALELELTLGGAKLTLDAKALAALTDAVKVRLAPVAQENGMGYLLSLTDASGRELTVGTEMLLALPLTEALAAHGKLGAYRNGEAVAATQSGDVIYLRPTACGTVLVLPVYAVTTVTSEGGTLLCETASALFGTSVTLAAHPEQGWKLSSLTATTASGAAVEVTENGFVMPAEDVTVQAVFEQIAYTVVFVSGGREISREAYHYGDTVTPPEDPVWEGEVKKGERYTFTGWSPVIVPVTEDATYTAEFSSAAKGVDPYRSGENSNRLLTVVLPITVAVAALAVGFVVLWRVKPRWWTTLLQKIKK